MKEQTERQQDEGRQGKHRMRLTRKKRVVISVILAFSALLALPVFAWLYMHRSMETITKVNMPNALLIGAGDAKPIQQLELSNIDVSGAQKYKDVVFCVYSTKPGLAYHLQLAHTTNIGFSYEIDKASIETDAVNGSIFYLGDYYKKGSKLAGNYLNKETESNYATNAYHEKTYEKYGNVQISAEPLYWKTASQEKLPDERQKPDKNGNYVNYYILHITWDETVQNNKETDMIYIMAGGVTAKSLHEMMADSREDGMKEGMEKGMTLGLTKGLEKGRIEALSDLLKKGTISIQDAADCMAMSVTEFKKLVNTYSV